MIAGNLNSIAFIACCKKDILFTGCPLHKKDAAKIITTLSKFLLITKE
jgi:hypothetical protein